MRCRAFTPLRMHIPGSNTSIITGTNNQLNMESSRVIVLDKLSGLEISLPYHYYILQAVSSINSHEVYKYRA